MITFMLSRVKRVGGGLSEAEPRLPELLPNLVGHHILHPVAQSIPQRSRRRSLAIPEWSRRSRSIERIFAAVMSPVLSVPLAMIPVVPMVPMVLPVAPVIPMVVSIVVLVEGKGVEKRLFQTRLFFPFNDLCQLLKLVELHAGSLRGQHVVDRVQVEEDGSVVLRVGLPLLPHLLHLLHVLHLQQLLGLAGHQGGSGEHQAWEQGREKCRLHGNCSGGV